MECPVSDIPAQSQVPLDRLNKILQRLHYLRDHARASGERVLYSRSVGEYSLIDCYVKMQLSLIFHVQISGECDVVRKALRGAPCVAPMNGTGPVLQLDAADVSIMGEGNQEAMFVSLVENVNGPDGKVTSVVRAYNVKHQSEKGVAGHVYFCPAQGGLKGLAGRIHGELGELAQGERSTAFDSLNPGIIEGAFEIVDRVPDPQSGFGENLISVLDIVNESLIRKLRVNLDSGNVTIWQVGEPFLQFTDVFVGPFDFCSGVAKCHRAKE